MPKKTTRKIIPYLTTTPWLPYTSRERKRDTLLTHCPSARCRRAKACIDAHDGIYCQRSHESVAEARARQGLPPPPAVRRRYHTLAQIRAKAVETEMALAQAEAQSAEMRERWTAGEFDHLYGKFRPGGVLKHPPERQYTE
jgi:hypothetical protein